MSAQSSAAGSRAWPGPAGVAAARDDVRAIKCGPLFGSVAAQAHGGARHGADIISNLGTLGPAVEMMSA